MVAGRRSGSGMFLLFLVVGLYLINTWGFLKLPAMFDAITKWVIIIGGVLLVIGGFKFLSSGKRYPQ